MSVAFDEAGQSSVQLHKTGVPKTGPTATCWLKLEYSVQFVWAPLWHASQEGEDFVWQLRWTSILSLTLVLSQARARGSFCGPGHRCRAVEVMSTRDMAP